MVTTNMWDFIFVYQVLLSLSLVPAVAVAPKKEKRRHGPAQGRKPHQSSKVSVTKLPVKNSVPTLLKELVCKIKLFAVKKEYESLTRSLYMPRNY